MKSNKKFVMFVSDSQDMNIFLQQLSEGLIFHDTKVLMKSTHPVGKENNLT